MFILGYQPPHLSVQVTHVSVADVRLLMAYRRVHGTMYFLIALGVTSFAKLVLSRREIF